MFIHPLPAYSVPVAWHLRSSMHTTTTHWPGDPGPGLTVRFPASGVVVTFGDSRVGGGCSGKAVGTT
jgi:hypothetical protein